MLLPDVSPTGVEDDVPAAPSAGAAANASDEMVPALADRLFRAASGRSARLAADGANLLVEE